MRMRSTIRIGDTRAISREHAGTFFRSYPHVITYPVISIQEPVKVPEEPLSWWRRCLAWVRDLYQRLCRRVYG